MSLSVAGGPTVSESSHFDTGAYAKIEAVIPKSSVPTTVPIQPGFLAEVNAIAIIADNYEDLTFVVDDGMTPFTLSGPLLLIGPGAIGMLGLVCSEFIFQNADAETDANVTILVAWDSIQPLGE